MIYPIYIYGSAVLRKKAKEIDKDYEGLQTVIENMFETMSSSDGIGLAAPQIGKSIRLFIVDGNLLAEDEPELLGFKKVFINPEIVERSEDMFTYNEGCLSVPALREDIIRPTSIRIKYYDENFNFYDEEYDAIKSRIIQHEYDHIEGTLFVDLVSPLRKKILKGKLNGISKGKFEAKYKVRIT